MVVLGHVSPKVNNTTVYYRQFYLAVMQEVSPVRISHFFKPLSVLFLLLVIALLPAQRLVGAAPTAAAPPTPDQRERLPHLPEFAAAATGSEPPHNAASPLPWWSAGVYQFATQTDWEIMLINDGRETRLTYHGAMDIHPRLNRGATKIAFASNRTGDYQIYTMNLDGSGVTQLTFTRAHNVNPAWSPDGTKIAFESYRDGQAEIYVMDANGANQQRLTWSEGPDTHPTWSPDGDRIAFSSRRTGSYRIWTMRADGSDLRQVTTQPYSLYPAWSPDGQWIAYSCDSNNDGWLEAWKIKPDGTAPTLMYNAQYYGPFTRDVMVRSWTPDGERVVVTVVDLIYYEGEWYWTRTWLLAALESNNAWAISNTDVGWNPDVQTKDTEPPIVTLSPLPAYHRAGKLRVRADRLMDMGQFSSGVAQVELQYRTGDAPWQSNFCDAGCLDFLGGYYYDVSAAAGVTMTFRIRGQDRTLNTGAWFESDAGTPVVFYHRKLSGQVLDTRATPRYGVSITGAPQLLGERLSDLQGLYTLYSTVSETHTIAVTQTGYGMLPPTPLSLLTDTVRAYVLPPRQDLIHNGHFEAALAPTWRVSGSVTPTLTAAAAHSGQRGVLLGRRAPGAGFMNISNLPDFDQEVALIFDAAGNLHAAWTHIASNYEIVATRCTPEMVCDLPQVISSGNYAVLAAAPNGEVYLVWYRSFDHAIMFAVRNSNGSWSAPSKIADAEPQRASYPNLTCDPQGGLHLVYNYDNTILYKHRPLGGAWGAAETVTASGEYGTYTTITAGPDGAAHIVVQDYINRVIRYHQRSANGQWRPAQVIGSPHTSWYKVIAMTLDGNGELHVLYSPFGYNGDTLWKTRATSGVWSEARTIASGVYNLNIGALRDGRLVAAWRQGQHWLMTSTDATGEWRTPQPLLLDGIERSALAVHPELNQVGLAMTRWVDGNADVYATITPVWTEAASTSQIAQTLTLPPEIHAPTLAFVYQYHFESGTSPGIFTVSVFDGADQTTLLTVNAASNPPTLADQWTQAWFDMNAWRGKTITVTLALSDTADGVLSWVTLDEVTLGAWETPQITTLAPGRLDVGVTAPVTITGGNFIATPVVLFGSTPAAAVEWVNASTLRATPPATLAAGVYDVVVRNPGGAAATLFGGLRVGRQMYLPVTLRITRRP